MLAQNFKSADELNITEPQKEALMKTLVLLETGRLELVDPDSVKVPRSFIPMEKRKFCGQFNMGNWSFAHTCGTVCCIGGTAELIGGLTGNQAFDDDADGLSGLFYPKNIGPRRYADLTPAQAATALRSYLTTGDARWDLAVQS